MITNKKKELLESTYDKVIHVGFCLIPYEDLSSIFAKDMIAFGTTKDELMRTFDEMDALFKSQFEQMGDIIPVIKRERIATQFSSDENQVIISEIVAMTMKTEEFTNTLTVRTSAVLDWVIDKWIFVHWHASSPVNTENDHWHFDEWKKENERLQVLIDEQTADLRQKNRELEIEAVLERVRAQAMAMKESSDLLDIVVTMRSEFVSLGHEAHYFWHMRWLPLRYEKAMTSGDGTKIGMVMSLPRHIHGDIQPVAEWEQGSEPIYVLAMDAETAVDYVDKMITLGDFERVDPHAPTLDDVRNIGGLTFVMARTTHGEIGYSLPGVVPQPPNEAVDTLKRFASVFDLAYKRFEDLKAAEKQALLIREERDRLEIALNDLKSTQDQLIQREKLASLGQLTAGIAHEIKNPLNFVNNFSEVSLEMIDEAMEETRKVGDNLHAQETIAILTDIKANMAKILEHGSRADGIVKSMLMHSRGGSGTLEPTELNALVREYVNLAFHGMRAGKDPINVDIDLQLDESVGEVPLIAEEFSRVILNLCNNAFDTLREKTVNSKLKTEDFAAKLVVRTKRDGANVTIEIEDNGVGIPDDIKDKILQPFFTTKKGTQGTGLGLSITHDIIKAHGGTMDVQSNPGQTIFKISINN